MPSAPTTINTITSATPAMDDHKISPAGDMSESEYWQEPHYDSPLYTEINIPLPPLPGTPVLATTPASPTTPESKARHSRSRSHTLSSFSPFHRRRSSSPSASISATTSSAAGNSVDYYIPEERTEKVERHEQRIELSMRAVGKGSGRKQKKRSGTVGAAIVPAVMVLGAELFTPGVAERERVSVDGGKDRLEVGGGRG